MKRSRDEELNDYNSKEVSPKRRKVQENCTTLMGSMESAAIKMIIETKQEIQKEFSFIPHNENQSFIKKENQLHFMLVNLRHNKLTSLKIENISIPPGDADNLITLIFSGSSALKSIWFSNITCYAENKPERKTSIFNDENLILISALLPINRSLNTLVLEKNNAFTFNQLTLLVFSFIGNTTLKNFHTYIKISNHDKELGIQIDDRSYKHMFTNLIKCNDSLKSLNFECLIDEKNNGFVYYLDNERNLQSHSFKNNFNDILVNNIMKRPLDKILEDDFSFETMDITSQELDSESLAQQKQLEANNLLENHFPTKEKGSYIYLFGQIKNQKIIELIYSSIDRKRHISEIFIDDIIIHIATWEQLSKFILGENSTFNFIEIKKSKLQTEGNTIIPLLSYNEYSFMAELLKNTSCKKIVLSEYNMSFEVLTLFTTSIYSNPSIEGVCITNIFNQRPKSNRFHDIKSLIWKLDENYSSEKLDYKELYP